MKTYTKKKQHNKYSTRKRTVSYEQAVNRHSDANYAYYHSCDDYVQQKYRFWTVDEDLFLIDNYKALTPKSLAMTLGSTVHSVEARRQKLGLLYRSNTKYSQEFIDEILTSTEPSAVLAEKYNLAPRLITALRYKYSL